MTAKPTQADKAEAMATLKKYIQPGDTLFTIVRSVAKSGMSRRIDVIAFMDGYPIYLTWAMATLGIAGMKRSQQERGARIDGCGMDMCYHAVDCLSLAILGESGKLFQRNI
jgi:hypothetical protein